MKLPVLGFLMGLTLLATAQTSEKRIDLKVEKTDVREALRTIFKQVGASYSIAPEVQGAVSADFRGLVLEDALRVVLRQVDAGVRPQGDVLQIMRADMIGANPMREDVDPTALASDGAFLFLARSGRVAKIDKATMKPVASVGLHRIAIIRDPSLIILGPTGSQEAQSVLPSRDISIQIDGPFLYATWRGRVYKIEKATMKLVANVGIDG